MLFNSIEFIFAFLPVSLAGYLLLLRGRATDSAMPRIWLAAASMGFYASWRPPYLILLVLSILFNYQTARSLHGTIQRGDLRAAKRILVARIALNLALLGYFKYLGFGAEIVNAIFGTNFKTSLPVLPLGISFYTFTEIAFLVDIYRRVTVPGSLRDYVLFVTFFPHLIAGPIVHYRQLIHQFNVRRAMGRRVMDLTAGLSLFVAGLFKKAVLADSFAAFGNNVFDRGLPAGVAMTFFPAWGAALSYSFQLYFDFSGYSDMAIGLAWMFGVSFPRNFASPYQATSIVDFWKRWHITLSDFLREYVYIPLGGNRKGSSRRYLNLFLTMLIGGIWHGAGWTFVVWGALHGSYLVVNHLWRAGRALRAGRGPAMAEAESSWLTNAGKRALTFLAVVVAWTFFRAHDCGQAVALLRSMAGLDGIVVPPVLQERLGALVSPLRQAGVRFEPLSLSYWGGAHQMAWLLVGFLLTMAAPNTGQIFRARSGGRPWYRWRPTAPWAVTAGIAFTVSVVVIMSTRAREFLYFNF